METALLAKNIAAMLAERVFVVKATGAAETTKINHLGSVWRTVYIRALMVASKLLAQTHSITK